MNSKKLESDYAFVKACRENPHQLTYAIGTVGLIVVLLCTTATTLTVLYSLIVIMHLVQGPGSALSNLAASCLLGLAVACLGIAVFFVYQIFCLTYDYYNFEAYEARVLPLIQAASIASESHSPVQP